jgi:division protein CdvB (Snf7/Vps24/ESCRT-III family)
MTPELAKLKDAVGNPMTLAMAGLNLDPMPRVVTVLIAYIDALEQRIERLEEVARRDAWRR